MSSVLGPSYNYADHIKKPKDMGVSNSGNIFVSIRDLNAIYPYIDTLIYGKNVFIGHQLISSSVTVKYTGRHCISNAFTAVTY